MVGEDKTDEVKGLLDLSGNDFTDNVESSYNGNEDSNSWYTEQTSNSTVKNIENTEELDKIFEDTQNLDRKTVYNTNNINNTKTGKKQNKSDFNSYLITLIVCIFVITIVTKFVFVPVKVVGSSMYPTLQDGEVGVSDKIGYTVGKIKRFDVVIVYLPEKSEYIVKRVIGLPGETVEYKDGVLYINGKKTEEPFLNKDYIAYCNDNYGGFMSDVDKVTLSGDEYFCLGDNRPNSADSRVYGPFKESQILSKGIMVFFPLNKMKLHTW